MEQKTEASFEAIQKTLGSIDVSGFTEEKEGGKEQLTYLSWSFAWGELIKIYPNASYEVERFENNLPYLKTEEGYMVFTKVTIEGHAREMWLPVMDANNMAMKSQPYTYETKTGQKKVKAADMNAINKAIMRCLVKNIAMFGLGLNVYQGEDLPNVDDAPIVEKKEKLFCEACGKEIQGHGSNPAEKVAERTKQAYGKQLCYDCAVKESNNKKGE